MSCSIFSNCVLREFAKDLSILTFYHWLLLLWIRKFLTHFVGYSSNSDRNFKLYYYVFFFFFAVATGKQNIIKWKIDEPVHLYVRL